MEKKPYTISDVARELGVSKTTVSRALSGKGRISKETVERVRNYIEANDFNPNVMARGLAQSKTYNLALVLPTDYIEHEAAFFKECMGGICQVAAAHDYDLLLAMAEGQLERMVANHKVDGVLLCRAVENDPVPQWLKEKQVPFVLIGTPRNRDCAYVDNQNYEAGRELTAVLLGKGAKNPVLLGGDVSYQVTENRCRGFLEACENFHLEDAASRVFLNLSQYPTVRETIDRMLADGADAFICMDDYICNLAMQALYERKVAVPGQVWVASMYDHFLLEYRNPPVTAVRFHTARLGADACAMLLRKMGETVAEETVEIGENYQVILRESTR